MFIFFFFIHRFERKPDAVVLCDKGLFTLRPSELFQLNETQTREREREKGLLWKKRGKKISRFHCGRRQRREREERVSGGGESDRSGDLEKWVVHPEVLLATTMPGLQQRPVMASGDLCPIHYLATQYRAGRHATNAQTPRVYRGTELVFVPTHTGE